MLEVTIQHETEPQQQVELQAPISIGRGEHQVIRLKSWKVGKQHAQLLVNASGVFIQDMGSMTGTYVNGRRVVHAGPLSSADEIYIGAYLLKVRELPPENWRANSEEPANATPSTSSRSERASAKPAFSATQSLELLWRQKLHARLLDALDVRRRDVLQMTDDDLRHEANRLLEQIIQEAQPDLPLQLDRQSLQTDVLNEAIGLGPLEALLADPQVSEIMVNRYDEVFIEKQGRLQAYPTIFSSERAVLGVIERIVAPIGRRIDESSPMVDARLKDGSRVNAVIPPIALKGSSLTIRKFPLRRLQVEDLLQVEALDSYMARYLECCVRQKRSIVISGSTGSGKTTLLNILSSYIPDNERIVTIEDAAELRLHQANLISLEARPANLEGKGQVSIRDLVKNALRMRPDRIVIGECRGAESLDMLQAMNTGHEGSLTTLHANTPRDALARLETMVLMAGMDLPLQAIREQITSAVHVIVQQIRRADGKRIISSIVEVTGMESGKIQLQEIFRFHAATQAFEGLGVLPNCYEDWKVAGVDVDPAWFQQQTRLSAKGENTFATTAVHG